MKKRVVFLITGLYYGGMERVVFIAYELLKEIYDIKVVALYAKDADYRPDIEILDLKCPPKNSKISKGINLIKRTIAVKKMKKNLNPDIVISFGPAANFTNAVTKRKDKIVIGIRSYDWLTNYFMNHKADRWVYNKADIVSSVSKVIANKAEEVFEIDKQKSKTVYNPYDVNYINQRANETVTDINVKGNGQTIISVGRLVNQKGFNHLIKAFAIVLKDFPNAQLIIIGQGEKENDLRKLISDLDIDNHVLLLGGRENPYKYMKLSDIYVLSSMTEGFPNAMVEAMSVGLPILAVDCKSGPREILSLASHEQRAQDIEKSEYGIISREVSQSLDYNANNIEECDYILANGIKMYLKDPDLRSYYSKKSYVRAQEFTYEKFKSNLVNIFENI